jgi:hypothetical protein
VEIGGIGRVGSGTEGSELVLGFAVGVKFWESGERGRW